MAEHENQTSQWVDDVPVGPGAEPQTGEPVEIIRSEERLQVRTRTVPVRRARLEKFEVTEMRTITVPVVREDVRIVYEALDPESEVPPGEAPADRRRWVLTEERVVVTKERVPVETVQLVVETLTEQQEVTEEVRKEQVTLHTSPAAAGRPGS